MTHEPLNFQEPLKITEEDWYRYDRNNYIKKHAHLIYTAWLINRYYVASKSPFELAVENAGKLFDAIRAEVKE